MTQPTRHVHSFFAAKGGQGTTVVAAAVALIHAQAGRRTLLVDAADQHDTFAVLGMPEPVDLSQVVAVGPNLDLQACEPGTDLDATDGYEVVIIDAGRHRPAAGTATLVTRACYLALRRAIAFTPAPDNAVLVYEPGRALNRSDVAAVLSVPIIVSIPADPAVARVVDAGLLAAGLPASLRELREEITAPENAPA